LQPCLTSPEPPNLNLDAIERTTMLNSNLQSILTDSWAPLAKKIDALERAIRAHNVYMPADGVPEFEGDFNPFADERGSDCYFRSIYIEMVDGYMCIPLSCDRIFRACDELMSLGFPLMYPLVMLRLSLNIVDCWNDLKDIPDHRPLTNTDVLRFVVPYIRALLPLLEQIEFIENEGRARLGIVGYDPSMEHLTEDVDLLNMLAEIEDACGAQIERGSH